MREARRGRDGRLPCGAARAALRRSSVAAAATAADTAVAVAAAIPPIGRAVRLRGWHRDAVGCGAADHQDSAIWTWPPCTSVGRPFQHANTTNGATLLFYYNAALASDPEGCQHPNPNPGGVPTRHTHKWDYTRGTYSTHTLTHTNTERGPTKDYATTTPLATKRRARTHAERGAANA